MTAKPDTLEVIHHEVPETAAGAGAAPIPARTYSEGGVTWRRMLRAVALAEAGGFAILIVAALLYGAGFFMPGAIAVVLFTIAAWRLPKMTKAGAVYGLVVSSLALLFFGGMFFGWTGFLHPKSWFEMSFAVLCTVVPIAGIVAGVATVRRRDGDNAARTPYYVTAVLTAALVLVGIVGSVASSDATRLPGDVTLTAHNLKFQQTTLTAKAGNVAIYFENKDPFAHNVKIEGHGGSKDADGRNSIRYVFRNLSAGTYAYFCEIHKDDMKGTLTVT